MVCSQTILRRTRPQRKTGAQLPPKQSKITHGAKTGKRVKWGKAQWLRCKTRDLGNGTGFRLKTPVSRRSGEARPGLLTGDLVTGRGLTRPQLLTRTQEMDRDAGVRHVPKSAVDLDLWIG